MNALSRPIQRREFLTTSFVSASVLAIAGKNSVAAEKPAGMSFAKLSKIRLGTVTYNLAQSWDIETIIKNCEEAKFEGVELRTSHAHGVEVTLSKSKREKVANRFRNSKVELMGLGSAFDFHTPDQEKLKRDIAATKEYIVLAHDVGAPGVKVRPNALPKEVSPEKTLEQIGKSRREIATFGQDHGVQIRLEVHGSGTQFVPRIKTILDTADHANLGACWNCNAEDLSGDGWDANFNLIKKKIFTVHMRDLYLEDYPFRKLFAGLNEIGFNGFCLAEIQESKDPVRVMHYYRSLFLAYQGLL